MCGIAGIFHGTGHKTIERQTLERMNRSLTHRGPDGEGYYVKDGIGLGHRRLSIIDLEGGQQPMVHGPTGHVISYNGEIYNFLDLKAELEAEGHLFRTRSDTEVLLAAWVQWGPGALDRLRGMYAFAVWDPATETLHLVRDKIGKKPLYYSVTETGTCLFGSELKALIASSQLDQKIDPQAVADYLTYGYIPDPKSIYSSVRKLPPGHRLEFKRGQSAKIIQYWQPEFVQDQNITYEQAVEDTLPRLDEAVLSRLISDVPLGAFLSGGVDSTAVVASMAASGRAQPLETFSVGFGDPELDELKLAQKHAQRYRTQHHEHIVDPEAPDLFETATRIYDEPFGDSSSMPTFQVCAAAKEHVTVALSGDGGDEAFAGYRRYTWHLQEHRVRKLLPAGFRSKVFGALGAHYPKLDQAPRFLRFKNTFQELALCDQSAYFRSLSVIDPDLFDFIISPKLKTSLGGYQPSSVLQKHWIDSDTDDPLNMALYVDWQMWLPGRMLVKVDRASMANSLEVRCPFLDHDLLEWSSRLPSSFKMQGTNGKRVLKKALEGRVDHGILYKSKQGFAPPISSWLRTKMREELVQAFASEHFRDSGYFNADAIDRILKDHTEGKRDHGPVLWSLLVFERFLRRHAKVQTPAMV